MSAGEALLEALPPITFVVGKGGVGKTTCAAAVALMAARRAPTLLVSTDPARALPSVLGVEVGNEATPVAFAPALSVRMLDAPTLRAAFMDQWGDMLRAILDRGTYLDAADIAPLVDTALPGGDEIFAALELSRLVAEGRGAGANRLVIDTAPTGHTLRLLALPRTFHALLRLFDAMQDKHRFMVRALTHSYRTDAVDEFLTMMRRRIESLEAALRDPARCGALLVTNAQPIVLAESRRYLDALREVGPGVAAVVWNGESRTAPLDGARQVLVPRLPRPPVGAPGLAAWFHAMVPAPAPVGSPAAKASARGEPGSRLITPEWLAPLTIVAGKGGVGKTTVACALALAASDQEDTLLVSTDPAPSLADALAQPVPDSETDVAGAPRLKARQMDATAAFERLRSEYSTRVDALFEALVDRGVNLAADRAIARDLLELAPPGVDEIHALTLLAEALGANRFTRIVVDPAPTGHLLRLLEMPRLALSWTHQLMRLMLRYKDVAGLGETAGELLGFARSLRAVEALLADPGRSGIVLVTLDEPVVRAESERLAAAVAERGVVARAVVHNRGAGRSLPVGGAGVQVVAPSADEPLVGVDAILRWSATWRPADPNRS